MNLLTIALTTKKLGVCLFRRNLSSSEVSTALRPFFFLVHPDLFGKYPREQEENERNLKTLKNYVDTMVSKKRPNPKEVQFFVKPRSLNSVQHEKGLPRIKLRLRDANLRSTVLTILRGAGLPTGFVDNIPEDVLENVVVRKEEAVEDTKANESDEAKDESKFSSTDKRQPFIGWLASNITIARQRLTRCEPIRLETERLQGKICYEYQLRDILWDCGWETVHRRGVVEAFLAVVTQHPEVVEIIRDRTIVFGKNSGVSVDGDIILYSGEVRNNWLNLIKTAPETLRLLETLPLYERALSQSLRGIRVVRDGGNIVMVDEHRARLRQLVTAVNDFRTRRSFPSSWPDNMSSFGVRVEGAASALMISEDGVFVVPASTPGFLIVEFLTQGMEEAVQRMGEYASLSVEEGRLVSRCINELGLIQMDRDDSLAARHMVNCCKKLLKFAPRLRHLTHGNHLIVARYYMVKSDGVICIPWDLVITDSNADHSEWEEGDSNRRLLPLTMY